VYGVPQDLDLNRFVGATLIQVCLGEFQVQFHFQAAGGAGSEGTLYIGVERRWELRDSSGRILDSAEPNLDPAAGAEPHTAADRSLRCSPRPLSVTVGWHISTRHTRQDDRRHG
jgi:hypothetical protein